VIFFPQEFCFDDESPAPERQPGVANRLRDTDLVVHLHRPHVDAAGFRMNRGAGMAFRE
jgi:hypothetical protein